MLVTVLSRCRRVEVPPIDNEELKLALMRMNDVEEREAQLLANCARGSYSKALAIIKKDNLENVNYSVFMEMLEAAISKDLIGLFDIWEKVSLWGKESQKQFCSEGMELIRKLYMISLSLEELSFASRQERERLTVLSGRIKKDFFEKAYLYLESASDSVERNVNAKFIFCDLCNRFYYTI